MGSYLNPGSDLFEMALQSQIFVDKSGLIEKTNRCVRTLQRYLCVSRPRRFGKSMAADMLAAYYDKNTKVHQCMIEKNGISIPLRHCICCISFRGQLPVRRRSCISGMAIKRCRSVKIKLRI